MSFKKCVGFLRGLYNEYKTKVKTQNLKTLEDASKSTQIYDDVVENKSSHVFKKQPSHFAQGVSN